MQTAVNQSRTTPKRLQALKPDNGNQGNAILSLHCQRTGTSSKSLLTAPVILLDQPMRPFSHLPTFSLQKALPAIQLHFAC